MDQGLQSYRGVRSFGIWSGDRARHATLELLAFDRDAPPLPLPLAGRLVPAGFPSPADDYLDGTIDLNALLIERPAATFLMRVTGDSMKGASILDGDLVVVDRSVEPRPGHIVVAVLDGDLTLKRLRRLKDGRSMLQAENPDYPPFIIGEEVTAEIWGVVVGVVRQLR